MTKVMVGSDSRHYCEKEIFSIKTLFEEQGIEYRQMGDYMVSNVELAEQKDY